MKHSAWLMTLFGLSLCLHLPPLEAAEASPLFQWTVRDATSGARLSSEIKITCKKSSHRILLPSGRRRLKLDGEGSCWLVASSPGYRNLKTSFSPTTNPPLPSTLWLEPAGARQTPKTQQNVMQGYVYDAETGTPIAGALFSFEIHGWGAVSDRKGYFEIPMDLDKLPAEELPPADVLHISADGYIDELREDFLCRGESSLLIDLEPGNGERNVQPSHKLLQPEAVFLDAPAESAEKVLAPLVPPATIRVGTSCSCTSCSQVSVMSLETYVRRGLNDEWIASWADNSLRAGAVAYRSYGAWYVEHPISSGSYDICSTTCCQVNDADTSSKTDLAGTYTAGFMLESGGAIFRAEYSAENNAWDDPDDGLGCSNSDLSCGDGQAGSPSSGWSCVTDPLCAGHGCFGHGRGMCQWGTQRLASISNVAWTEIIDHYYNDEGAGTGQRTAEMTSPLFINSLTSIPPAMSSMTIEIEAISTTESDHDHILIGASLYSTATGYISDPAHDQLVTLSPGSNSVSRNFDIPGGTPEGLYDLYVSLYFDVDGDGSITTADKALDLVLIEEAVTISAEIFSDGFESGDLRRWSS